MRFTKKWGNSYFLKKLDKIKKTHNSTQFREVETNGIRFVSTSRNCVLLYGFFNFIKFFLKNTSFPIF